MWPRWSDSPPKQSPVQTAPACSAAIAIRRRKSARHPAAETRLARRPFSGIPSRRRSAGPRLAGRMWNPSRRPVVEFVSAVGGGRPSRWPDVEPVSPAGCRTVSPAGCRLVSPVGGRTSSHRSPAGPSSHRPAAGPRLSGCMWNPSARPLSPAMGSNQAPPPPDCNHPAGHDKQAPQHFRTGVA